MASAPLTLQDIQDAYLARIINNLRETGQLSALQPGLGAQSVVVFNRGQPRNNRSSSSTGRTSQTGEADGRDRATGASKTSASPYSNMVEFDCDTLVQSSTPSGRGSNHAESEDNSCSISFDEVEGGTTTIRLPVLENDDYSDSVHGCHNTPRASPTLLMARDIQD